MQYDIGFNDKSACNKISEITFYCFYLLSTNFPFFFFFVKSVQERLFLMSAVDKL